MAERIEAASVTVNAGVQIASPVNVSVAFNPGVLRRLEIVVPPGPSGLVGFRVRHSTQIVIPRVPTGWIITDDEKIGWDMSGYPTGSKWSLQLYNLDVYPHTLQTRWLLDEIPTRPGSVLTPVAIA